VKESLFIDNGIFAITVASLITYAFRLGGLLLADRLPRSGPLRTFLDGLPGALLLSLVVPGAIHLGLTGCIGLGACLFAYWRTGNLLATMTGGVVIVALIRMCGFH